MEERSAFCVALIGLATALSACGGSSSNGNAAQGTERGPCYPNETCNAGLICLSDTCVVPPSSDAGLDATMEMDATPKPVADSGTDVTTSGSDGGAEGGFPFTPSNIPLTAIDFSGVDDIELTDTHGCVIDTGSGSISCDDAGIPARFHFAQLNQPGIEGGTGIPLGVFVAKSLKVDPLVTVRVVAPKPSTDGGLPGSAPALGLIVSGSIDIEGTLQAQLTPSKPWPDVNLYFYAPGGRAPSLTEPGSTGGSFCGTGGRASSNARLLLPGLVPLVGGQGDSESIDGVFSGGGGALQLVAAGALTIGASGVISAPGGGGDGYAGTVGGGSGGAILLEATDIGVYGTIAANGGAGNGASDTLSPDGTSSANPATDPNGGGTGSAGTTINGGTSSTGAGGGGAGTIRLNSRTGLATLDPKAIISPAPSTPCLTQGILR